MSMEEVDRLERDLKALASDDASFQALSAQIGCLERTLPTSLSSTQAELRQQQQNRSTLEGRLESLRTQITANEAMINRRKAQKALIAKAIASRPVPPKFNESGPPVRHRFVQFFAPELLAHTGAMEKAMSDFDFENLKQLISELPDDSVNSVLNVATGDTLLHMAAACGIGVEQLLEKGADANLTNLSGEKPIHLCASNPSVASFEALRRVTADILAPPQEGGMNVAFRLVEAVGGTCNTVFVSDVAMIEHENKIVLSSKRDGDFYDDVSSKERPNPNPPSVHGGRTINICSDITLSDIPGPLPRDRGCTLIGKLCFLLKSTLAIHPSSTTAGGEPALSKVDLGTYDGKSFPQWVVQHFSSVPMDQLRVLSSVGLGALVGHGLLAHFTFPCCRSESKGRRSITLAVPGCKPGENQVSATIDDDTQEVVFGAEYPAFHESVSQVLASTSQKVADENPHKAMCLTAALFLRQNPQVHLYNIACYGARSEKSKNEVLKWLRRAVQCGYTNHTLAADDSDFGPEIRNEPEFNEILDLMLEQQQKSPLPKEGEKVFARWTSYAWTQHSGQYFPCKVKEVQASNGLCLVEWDDGSGAQWVSILHMLRNASELPDIPAASCLTLMPLQPSAYILVKKTAEEGHEKKFTGLEAPFSQQGALSFSEGLRPYQVCRCLAYLPPSDSGDPNDVPDLTQWYQEFLTSTRAEA